MSEPILRASFTLMKLWSNGQIDDAVKTYLRHPRETTPAMQAGLEHHKMWELEVQRTGNLPLIFGGKKLADPLTERRYEAQVTPWMSLRGVIDCFEGDTIHEFKTGVMPANDYANSRQVEVYAWLLAENGINARKAFYHVYHQHLHEVESAMVWITDERLRDAVEWMVTFGSDIHNYFVENHIYEIEANAKK
jgi:CRISPR/Cas system-associated exonuclease Cas4 (RecB family)